MPKNEPRYTERVATRITPEQSQRLAEVAEANGMTTSELVRMLLETSPAMDQERALDLLRADQFKRMGLSLDLD